MRARPRVAVCAIVIAATTLAPSRALATEPAASEPAVYVHGARLVESARAVLEASAGMNVLLPTVVLGVTAGVARGFDLALRYEVHGGLGHVFVLTGRASLHRSMGIGLAISQGFFAAEDVFGIQLVEAPFGNALVTTPRLAWSVEPSAAVHLGFAIGASVRWLALEQRTEETRRVFDPALQDVTLEVACEWRVRGGAAFLRFLALVPVQAELRVLGFLPTIVAGRTWGIE